MKELTLEIFLQFFGVSAASGLLYHDQQLEIISDNAHVLYNYSIPQGRLNKNILTENGALEEAVAKTIKKDYEAITSDGKHYYIFGSGSGSLSHRNEMVEVDAASKTRIANHDLDVLYQSMRHFAQLDEADFNIEGVVVDADTWYFFNRGNGPAAANGIFTVKAANLLEEFNIVYNPITLPKVQGWQTGFTDAVLLDGKFYFLAAAEKTTSTYEDGAIAGTLIGRINPKKMKLEKTAIISTTHKFEGLSLYKKDRRNLEFLLCEDPDNDSQELVIYKLKFRN